MDTGYALNRIDWRTSPCQLKTNYNFPWIFKRSFEISEWIIYLVVPFQNTLEVSYATFGVSHLKSLWIFEAKSVNAPFIIQNVVLVFTLRGNLWSRNVFHTKFIFMDVEAAGIWLLRSMWCRTSVSNKPYVFENRCVGKIMPVKLQHAHDPNRVPGN